MSKEINKTELKAVPKGEAIVLDEFKVKKNCIDLSQFVYNVDTEEYDKLEVKFSYEDIKGYSLNGPYIVVSLQDDTTYIHRADSFPVIKLFTKE
jgi:hypothetical protein